MTKRKKILVIIFAAIFVLMFVAYLAVIRPMLNGGDKESEPLDTVEGEQIGPNNRYLMFERIERENIDSIEVHNSTGEYTFYRDSSDSFQIKDYEGVTFSDETFAYLVVAAGYTLSEQRVMKDASDEQLDEFGLLEPQAYWILTTTDGDVHRVNVGKKLMSQKGFYCSYEGRSCVYVLSSQLENSILAPIESYVKPLLTAGMTQDNYYKAEDFSITHEGELFVSVAACEENEKVNPDSLLETKLIYPDGYRTNDTLYLNVLSSFISLTGEETVLLGGDEEEYKKYGLEDPYYMIHYKFEDYEFNIFISELQDDGYYYAISNLYNYKLIAKLSTDKMGWLENDLFSWISDDPLLINVATVDSIEIKTPQQGVTFNLKHGTGSDGNATLDVSTDSGISISNEEIYNFRQYYKALISVKLNGSAELTQSEIEELISDENNRMMSIKFNKTSGEAVEYAFYRYSTRQALMTVNGKGEFYVLEDFIEKLINDTQRVLEGLNIDSYSKK